MALALLGVDFSCAPSRRKPITVARGNLTGNVLCVDAMAPIPTLQAFEDLLAEPGPWCGAFDFPFGLPRAFVDAHALGADTDTVIATLHQRCGSRMAFRALVDAWGNARPAGQRLIHRRADGAMPGISSTSPLQTRYVPVGFMVYEGLSRLVQANVTIPRQRQGDTQRVALEGYPGLLAFELIGRRSYKNSAAADRLQARHDILAALEQGRTRLGVRLRLTPAQREALVDDPSGDRLDAVLCLVQAAWASTQPGHGVPADVDVVEGWITSAATPDATSNRRPVSTSAKTAERPA